MSASYAKAWEDYRTRRRRFFIVWPGALVVLGLALPLTGSSSLFWAGAVVYVVLFIAAGYSLSSFPCPRCDAPFFSTKWLANNQFRRTCGHCGLRKWAEGA
jgi:ribosomal protein S27AE